MTQSLLPKPKYKDLQEKLDNLNSIMQEDVNGARVIKAYVKENKEIRRFEKASKALSKIHLFVLKLFSYMNPITNLILKNSIARLRPFESSDQYWLWWLDAGSVVESGYSFPSGHTTATMAFALATFLTVNKKYSWPILLFPIVMASSRMYLMVHYFSDCVGGIVVGCASAVIAYLIVKWIYKSKLKER